MSNSALLTQHFSGFTQPLTTKAASCPKVNKRRKGLKTKDREDNISKTQKNHHKIPKIKNTPCQETLIFEDAFSAELKFPWIHYDVMHK